MTGKTKNKNEPKLPYLEKLAERRYAAESTTVLWQTPKLEIRWNKREQDYYETLTGILEPQLGKDQP